MGRVPWPALVLVLVAGAASARGPYPAADPPPTKDEAAAPKWCAPELDKVAEGACFHSGLQTPADDSEAPRLLVIFLHGLTGAGSSWQWEQQRLIARLADRFGFAALLPRGRLGIGPGRSPDVYAWPTAAETQRQVEAAVLAEIDGYRKLAEKRAGPFARTLVFGFSNGAYYATSLAFRGKLRVDGYGIFAGGSGNERQITVARGTAYRPPIFVGYGVRDPDRKNQIQLLRVLKRLDWRHQGLAAKAGHTVTHKQIEVALEFLTQQPQEPHASIK